MKNKQSAMHTPLNNEHEFENMDAYEPDEIIESSPNRKYVKLGCRLGSSNYKKIFRAKQKVPYAPGELPEVNEHGELQECKKVGVVWNVVTVSSLDQELIDKNTYIEEIERIRACDHPNLIRIIDSWQYEDDYVTITEEMSEGNIKEYIGVHGMPTRERLLDWLRQILAGLKCMHGMHIIHKNLKCSNVFLSVRDGKDVVKLGDFGISEAKFKNRMPIVGTPEFLPREIYEGSRYTEGVDVYSLGFLLIELCTGTWPYAECKDEFDLLKKVLLGQLPSAVHKIRDPCLKHLIFRCITSTYDRITVDELLEHHVFFPSEECSHFCICERPGTVLQLARSKNSLQCTLISIQPDAMHLQLHLPESEQFIRFKFHNDKDTIDSVMSEMLEEEIIRTNMYAELCDLFKTGIERAKKIKSLNIVEEGIFDVGMIEIKQIQLGEQLIMDVEQGYAYAGRVDEDGVDEDGVNEDDAYYYASPDGKRSYDQDEERRVDGINTGDGLVDGINTGEGREGINQDEERRGDDVNTGEGREGINTGNSPVNDTNTPVDKHSLPDQKDNDGNKNALDKHSGADYAHLKAMSKRNEKRIREDDAEKNSRSFMVESREVYGHSDASVLTMIQSKGVGDDGQSGKEENVDGESVEGYNGELMTENVAVKDVSTSVGEVSVVNPLESGSEQGSTPSDNEKRKEARNGVVSECVEGAYQNGVVEEGAISGVCAKTENEEVPCRSEELRESADDGNGTQSRDELLVPSLNLKKEGPDTKDGPALSHQKDVPEPVPSARKTENGRDTVHDEKDAKEDERASIENFVNETASIVNRTPDIANEWIKLLKEQEIDTVEDLKLLVEEDWDALGLPVFAARAMMNSLYGKDRQPVKEKHQTTNTSIPEYTDDLQIKDFIVDVCTLARKIENASLWEAKLTNQEIRTVGEFKSLHSKDWNKLGLSVFCYRILKNILNRKGRLPFVR